MNTRTVLLTSARLAAAGAALASAASDIPGDPFSFYQEQDATGTVKLGEIVAGPGSVIEVYDYHLARMGRLLVTKALNHGHNMDVQVNLGMPHNRDVLAVLRVKGAIVGQQVIRPHTGD